MFKGKISHFYLEIVVDIFFRLYDALYKSMRLLFIDKKTIMCTDGLHISQEVHTGNKKHYHYKYDGIICDQQFTVCHMCNRQ